MPFAALVDADGKFLIERTGLAIAPALAYSQPGRARTTRPLAIVAAALEREVVLPAGTFAKLEGTRAEAQAAAGPDAKVIDNFRKADLQSALGRGAVDVLHLATHAAFNGRSDRSFIVANDEAIPIADLRGLIQSGRARGDDLMLLVLSACETAIGDDQASMGLAGAAVQSGAESAVASLWEVNDTGTVALMRAFYERYRSGMGRAAAPARRPARAHRRRRRSRRSADLGGVHPARGLAMTLRHALFLAASACWTVPASAQSAATAIVPDTAPDRTTATMTAQAGTTTTIDGGTRVGTNLFHSFQTFSLGTGDAALWLRSAGDGAAIRTVVSRVTGGAPSAIDGTLATQGLPNADFFFINPAGIAFGANAQVAVPNAVHFSTADSLGFADGARFAATTPGGSTLTMAAPQSFGFLGRGATLSITGNTSGHLIAATDRLSLSAGSIDIVRSTLTAGGIDLSAVGTGAGSLSIADPVGTRFGNGQVTLANSDVETRTGAGLSGLVRVGASRVSLTGSTLGTGTDTALPGGALRLSAGSIALQSSFLRTASSGSGTAGSIAIDVGALDIDNGRVDSAASANALAGSIDVRADSIHLFNAGEIRTTNGLAPGSTGGDITLATRLLTIDSRGALDSSTVSSAEGGSIVVTADAVAVSGGGFIDTSTFASGNAGVLAITANSLTLDGGTLYSNAEAGATGAAGAIGINAATVTLRNTSGITTTTFGNGDAGLIDIRSTRLDVAARSEISSDTHGSGAAGLIDITTASATIAGVIAGEALQGSGDAGAVRIRASGAVAVTGSVTTSTATTGDAGFVQIDAASLSVDGGRVMSAANPGARGRSGAIAITAPLLTVTRGGIIETTSANALAAGEVDVTSTTLRVEGRGSAITSENVSRTGGAAGLVAIGATTINLLDGGALSTSALTGPAGDIVLTIARGGSIVLRGATDPGVIDTSSGPGTGGRITIGNPYLILSDGGHILALGDAAGANVAIRADFYIRSADRLNLLAVAGDLLVDSEIGDLSTGAEPIDATFLDASAVLRGQCPVGGKGGVSRLSIRTSGPYAAPPRLAPAATPIAAAVMGRVAASTCRW